MIVRRGLLVPGVIFTMLCALLVLGVLFPLEAGNTWVDHTKTGGDGLGGDSANAFLTLGGALASTRTAGDTIHVRATHKDTLAADIAVLSSGTPLAPIYLWGDDGSVWPLVHADSIATISTSTYEYSWFNDDYWHINRIKLRGFDGTRGALYIYGSMVLITDCQFVEGGGTGDAGIYGDTHARVIVRDCVFDGNFIGQSGADAAVGITSIAGWFELWNCSFDDFTRALLVRGGTITAYSCDFGVTETNTEDVETASGNISLMGCNMANPVYDNLNPFWGCGVYEYGLDANKRVDWIYDAEIKTLATNYTTLHSGGGAYSLAAEFAANEATGPTAPWYLAEYSVYADSAETRTYTMYAYRDASWTPLPAASELYLEVIAWDADSLKIYTSTETLGDSLAWYSLSAEVTPNHNGTVFVRLVCEDYDADGVLYIDPKLTATGETYHEMFAPLGPDLAYLYTAPAAGGKRWQQIIGGIPNEDDNRVRDPRGAMGRTSIRVRAR